MTARIICYTVQQHQETMLFFFPFNAVKVQQVFIIIHLQPSYTLCHLLRQNDQNSSEALMLIGETTRETRASPRQQPCCNSGNTLLRLSL